MSNKYYKNDVHWTIAKTSVSAAIVSGRSNEPVWHRQDQEKTEEEAISISTA